MRHLVQVVDLGESVGEEWRLGKWMRTCRELKGTSALRSVTNQRDQMLGNKINNRFPVRPSLYMQNRP